MSKEYLDALERLAMPDELHIKECEKLGISLTEDYNILKQYFESIDNAKPSEAMKSLESMKNRLIDAKFTIEGTTLYSKDRNLDEDYSTIKQALINSQNNTRVLSKDERNKALAFDYLVKHFNFECKADSLRDGEVWARFVTIQSKDDEGTWDTTAMANLVDYKEEYDFLEKMLKNIGE